MNIYSDAKDIIYGQLGHFFIILSFVSAIVCAIAYFIATQFSENKENARSWIAFGRKTFVVHTIAVIAVFVCYT
ncbi:MAG: hypothetical protein IPK18_05675 [Sphingobacteriales bacterium]|nr:MAG: hypothetical protein IPK18_05675 [Sphingobacteriales bacterium]